MQPGVRVHVLGTYEPYNLHCYLAENSHALQEGDVDQHIAKDHNPEGTNFLRGAWNLWQQPLVSSGLLRYLCVPFAALKKTSTISLSSGSKITPYIVAMLMKGKYGSTRETEEFFIENRHGNSERRRMQSEIPPMCWSTDQGEAQRSGFLSQSASRTLQGKRSRVCHNEDLYAEVDVVYRRVTRGRYQHLAPPSKVAKVNRLRFFGHILRRPAHRLVQRVLRSFPGSTWKKPANSSPGRKRKFWTEVVKENLRTLSVDRQFGRDVRFCRIWNRDEWIDHVQALAQDREGCAELGSKAAYLGEDASNRGEVCVHKLVVSGRPTFLRSKEIACLESFNPVIDRKVNQLFDDVLNEAGLKDFAGYGIATNGMILCKLSQKIEKVWQSYAQGRYTSAKMHNA
ncbi:hypothetical protein RB195_010557 [Necator americanus]|uniref:Uncharacterized protein n=1 Tax=Necator americanus TaxID=51031 RepID=A0ABR1CYH6_NECAM